MSNGQRGQRGGGMVGCCLVNNPIHENTLITGGEGEERERKRRARGREKKSAHDKFSIN